MVRSRRKTPNQVPLPEESGTRLAEEIVSVGSHRVLSRRHTEKFLPFREDADGKVRLITVAPYDRPRTREECPEKRPCPFAGCRHHLAIDVTEDSGILLNNPDFEDYQHGEEVSRPTCALDVAELGGASLADVVEAMGGGIVRERVRQLEEAALGKVAKAIAADPVGYSELVRSGLSEGAKHLGRLNSASYRARRQDAAAQEREEPEAEEAPVFEPFKLFNRFPLRGSPEDWSEWAWNKLERRRQDREAAAAAALGEDEQ